MLYIKFIDSMKKLRNAKSEINQLKTDREKERNYIISKLILLEGESVFL